MSAIIINKDKLSHFGVSFLQLWGVLQLLISEIKCWLLLVVSMKLLQLYIINTYIFMIDIQTSSIVMTYVTICNPINSTCHHVAVYLVTWRPHLSVIYLSSVCCWSLEAHKKCMLLYIITHPLLSVSPSSIIQVDFLSNSFTTKYQSFFLMGNTIYGYQHKHG